MNSLIDLGCHPTSMVSALPGAMLATLLFLLLAGLGNLVGGSKRWTPADIVSGWGLLAAAFTLGGIFIPGSLPLCAGLTGIAALIVIATSLYKHKCMPWPAWCLIALALQSWILVFINHVGIAGWDDIAQWTPNSLFLWRHDAFPNLNLPLPYSNRPAYPYALAYLDYAVSLMHGAFVVQAGAMINWLLLASFAWAMTEFEEKSYSLSHKLARLGVALLLTTLFNPGFNPSFTITGQSDAATSVVVGFLGLLFLRLHMTLRHKDNSQVRALSWQMASAALVLTLLRDMNIVLLALFALAFLLLALREKLLGPTLRRLGFSLLPALIFFILWHHYTGHAMAHDDTPPILPFAEWHWPMLPQLLRAAGMEMLKKNGFYLLMLGTSTFGLWAFCRGRRDKFGTLAILTALVFFGYCGFILTAFIGSSFFTEYNIAHAMSFYRYGTHTGLLGVIMLWFLFEKYLEPRMKGKTLIPLAVLSLGLLPLVYVLKPAWLVPQPSPAICAVRAFGNELAQQLPPQSRLAILDAEGNGFEPYIINLELAFDDLKTGHQSQLIAATNMFEPEKLPPLVAQIKAGPDINAVLLRHPTDELKQFFHLKGKQPVNLLLRTNKKWQPVALPPNGTP